MSATFRSPFLLAAALLVVGCGGGANRDRPSTPTGSRGGDAALAACDMEGSRREAFLDVNGDNNPDIRQVFEGSVERCRQVDLNFDGRWDVFHYYDAQGREVRLEDDLDFDGRVDQITFFAGGQVQRRELDTNFDNRFDTWEYYQGGTISRAERDTNGNGRADTWEAYANGRVARIQYDEDGDGHPDRTDDNPNLGEENAPQAQPAGAAPPPAAPSGAPPATPSATPSTENTEG